MKVIALTGGIGCGKSTVSRMFYEICHWQIIDADKICHELYEQNNTDLVNALTSRWGSAILDQDERLNRQKIGKIVFENPDELGFLNGVLHPMIFDEIEHQKTAAENNHCRIAVLDAPLLFECGWEHTAACVAAVWAPYPIQYQRLLERGWDPEHIQNRLNAQMSADEKMKRADFALINSGSKEWLKLQITAFARHIED